jgi:hypothetical protein
MGKGLVVGPYLGSEALFRHLRIALSAWLDRRSS